MRLPLTAQISTKDGVSNKNARLTNCLKEVKKSGEKAVVRPGLVLDAQASGVGNGLVVFNNELVSVYGATLGLNTAAGSSSFSLITDTIAADVAITAVRFMSGTQWLIGGVDFDIEEGVIYVLDTSVDSTTQITTGYFFVDVKAIASSGTTVVVATRDESFGGGPSTLMVSSVSPISFTEKSYTGLDPFSVKYADGKYVVINTAINSGSRVAWSTDDGSTWSTYLLAYERGRDLLFDGTAWWFYGWDNARATYAWAYKTTDFITFTEQTLTGLGATETVSFVAYSNGTYYMIGSTVLSSSNGKDWTTLTPSGTRVKEGQDGNVYMGKTVGDVLYRLDGLTLTTIASTAFTENYLDIDALADSSIIIAGTNADSVARIDDVGADTIPALATITGNFYDFAQSPI